MKLLDRSKHYAEVRNHPEIWYSQDGVDFDSRGEEITKDEVTEEAVEVKKPLRLTPKK